MIATAVSRERKLVESGSRGAGTRVLDILTLQDVDAAGFDLKVDWPPAAGATHAEVGSVTLHLGPAVRETHLGTLDATAAGSVVTVKAPAGCRLRSLAFTGLKNDAGTIGVEGRRLLVSLRDAKGAFSPSYAAPNLPKPAVGPAPLTDATLNGSTLGLPDVAGGPLQLSVVSGDTMADLAVLAGTTIGSVTGLAADPPFDLSLAVVGGAPVWGFPGELPAEAPDVEIDATSGVEAAMNAALAAGAALSVTLHLTASRPSTLALGRLKASGALLRAIPGPLEAALEGEPVRIAVPNPSPANETPGTVRGGLQWRYLGFRVLADRSDAASLPFAPMAGAVVAGTAVRRALPPAALDGERLGPAGRSPRR